MLVSSSEIGQRAVQHRNVIEAAKQAGVGRIVYTSVLHADTSPLDLAAEHRETEAALAEAGIPTTILRNGWYSENYAGSVQGALMSGALVGSAGEGRVSSAARADYAEAAATVLTSAGHEGKTYELAGDVAWTLPTWQRDLAPDRPGHTLQGLARGRLCCRAEGRWRTRGLCPCDRRLGRGRIEGRAIRRRASALGTDRASDHPACSDRQDGACLIL